MSKEQKNVPKRRFPEFTDEWEHRKLGEIVDVCGGRDYKHLVEGSIPVYGTGGYMLSVSEALSEHDDAIGIGRKGTIDNPYILKAPFWTVDTLFYCIPKKDYALDFVYCIYQNINWKALDESTGVPSLSKAVINGVDVKTPSKVEQDRIGCFFTYIDTLITLQQRKLDQIKEYKKGMLQKMFPKEGESVPEVRFPGFTGEWERKKLGELAEVKDSARIPNSEWTDSGVPYIRASDLTNDDTSGVLFISSERYDYYRSKTGAPAQGDVLFNGGGEIGKALLHSNNKPIYVQGGAVLYARTSVSESLDGQFLKTYFETPNAKSYIDIASAGGTMKHFTLKPSLEMPIQFPNIPEQLQLGSFFKSLDTLITLHQRKLEAMKEYKKGLLQQMFV